MWAPACDDHSIYNVKRWRYSRELGSTLSYDELGTVVYSQQQGEFIYSQKTAEKIDAEVKNILDKCFIRASGLLKDAKDKLDKLALALLEKETMYAGEIYELLGIQPRQEFKLE